MDNPVLWINDHPELRESFKRYELTKPITFQYVFWTGDSEDPETECRVVNLKLDLDGAVTVEHSRSEGGEGIAPEHITRLSIPGFEEE